MHTHSYKCTPASNNDNGTTTPCLFIVCINQPPKPPKGKQQRGGTKVRGYSQRPLHDELGCMASATAHTIHLYCSRVFLPSIR